MALPALVATLAPILPTLVGSALGLSGTLMGNLFNRKSVKETNASNRQMASEANDMNRYMFEKQFAYSKDLQQQLFSREDTSYQRTVSDLQAAGLSPLAMNGTNDAGSVVATPSFNPAVASRDIAFEGTFPQLQTGDIIESMIQSRHLEQEERRLDIEATKVKDAKELGLREDETKRKIAADDNSNRLSIILEQIKAKATETDKELSQRQSQFVASLDLQNRQLEHLQKTTEKEQTLKLQEYYLETVRQATDGRSANYEVFYDKAKYQVALDAYYNRLSDFVSVNQDLLGITSASASTSSSAGAGGSAGAIPGQNLGANANVSTSRSDSFSKNYTKEFDEKLRSFYAANPFPVLAPSAR